MCKPQVIGSPYLPLQRNSWLKIGAEYPCLSSSDLTAARLEARTAVRIDSHRQGEGRPPIAIALLQRHDNIEKTLNHL
jgi:hypothetical protein